MSRNLVDILFESQKLKRKYFYNYKFYCEKIKNIAKNNLKIVRVLVFGSVVRNEWQPKSDIDVLIISEDIPEDFEERTKTRISI